MGNPLIYENPTDYEQVYTQQQLKDALAQTGLPQEDQDSIISHYNDIVAGKPDSGSGGGGSGGGGTTQNPKWVYLVNMPSTYPDFAAMKAAGAGMVIDLNDANAATLIAEAKKWGVAVAVQVGAGNPGDLTPEQYASRVAQAKAMGADKLVLDIEGAGKGVPGSAGYDWAQQAAAAVKGVAGDTSIAVTMEPHQDDYNYKAFQGIGSDQTQFWVQTYTGDMTDVDQDWATASAKAAVGGSNVVALLSPNAKPTSGHTDGYVSYGIPQNGASAAGVYGTAPPHGGVTPVPPNTTPAPGSGSGPGIPGEIPATGPTPPGSPSPTTQPPPPTSTDPGDTKSKGDDWAAAYFGSLGLPSEVVDAVNKIFQKYPDTDQAVQFALAYIRGTSWYAQTFPGIQYGIQHGMIANEQDYRQYVTAIDTLAQRYWGRHISGSEISSFLFDGLTPDVIGKQYQGLANVMSSGADYNYYLGAFSEEGRQSTDNLRSLGEEQAGLDTPMGQKLQHALQNAVQRYSKLFEGQAATPSLSLGKNGLSAPSLLGSHATPDTGA